MCYLKSFAHGHGCRSAFTLCILFVSRANVIQCWYCCRYPSMILWLLSSFNCMFTCRFAKNLCIISSRLLSWPRHAFYRFYLVALIPHTLSHSMRTTFAILWSLGGFFSIICFFLSKMLCRFFSSLPRMLFIELVFRCAWCCFWFFQCLAYRIAQTHTLHINRKSFDRTFCSSYAFTSFHYHCYAFLFFAPFPLFPSLSFSV